MGSRAVLPLLVFLFLASRADARATLRPLSTHVKRSPKHGMAVEAAPPKRVLKLLTLVDSPSTSTAHQGRRLLSLSSETPVQEEEGECTQCPPGTFSVPGGAMCMECREGTYQPANASSKCLSCPPGSQSTANRTACESCGLGFYSTGGTQCQSCPEGFFVAGQGSSACFACAKGYFTSSRGTIMCSPCPSGTYSAQEGSSNCTACEDGWTTQGNAASACTIRKCTANP